MLKFNIVNSDTKGVSTLLLLCFENLQLLISWSQVDSRSYYHDHLKSSVPAWKFDSIYSSYYGK